MSPPTLDKLLACRPFVKRAARRIASDPALAEDIEQEAWVVALRRPPAHDGALHSWFAAVLRNVLLADLRAGKRRRWHEWAAFEIECDDEEPGSVTEE